MKKINGIFFSFVKALDAKKHLFLMQFKSESKLIKIICELLKDYIFRVVNDSTGSAITIAQCFNSHKKQFNFQFPYTIVTYEVLRKKDVDKFLF